MKVTVNQWGTECAVQLDYQEVAALFSTANGGFHEEYIVAMAREIVGLRKNLDDCQLRLIEASNPGIDMEKVKEHRRGG